MGKQSNSTARVGVLAKLRYNLGLLRMHWIGGGGDEIGSGVLAQAKQFRDEFEARTGLVAKECTVMEIGFGARPFHAFALTAFFGNVIAIDLDSPVLRLNDAVATFWRNGVQRGIKSLARYCLVDWKIWSQFHGFMRSSSPDYEPSKVKFIVGSAADPKVWPAPGSIDFIVSVCVLEHIPKKDLEKALALAKNALNRSGLMIAAPCVFTGIIGGHVLNWYPHKQSDADPDTAWSHLYDPTFSIDTYLNHMTRSQYRQAFKEAGFAIEREDVPLGRLGEKFLTPDIRAKLTAFPEEELFSNRVDFHLVAQ